MRNMIFICYSHTNTYNKIFDDDDDDDDVDDVDDDDDVDVDDVDDVDDDDDVDVDDVDDVIFGVFCSQQKLELLHPYLIFHTHRLNIFLCHCNYHCPCQLQCGSLFVFF